MLLEWSDALLSDAESRLFRRLGVFVGGVSLEAVQQVTTDERMNKHDLLSYLGALIDKSLVLASGYGNLIRCNRGRGTSAASHCMNSSGLITRCVVPSRHGFFSLNSTCPAALG